MICWMSPPPKERRKSFEEFMTVPQDGALVHEVSLHTSFTDVDVPQLVVPSASIANKVIWYICVSQIPQQPAKYVSSRAFCAGACRDLVNNITLTSKVCESSGTT